MIYYSNSQIIQILRNRPGGIQTFLLQVPIEELRLAIDQQQKLQDLRFRNSRAQFNHKYNVLDYPLKTVIKYCKDQGFINYFDYKIAEKNCRLVSHPYYGQMLVNRLPEKYYIGDKSKHYSHARRIQRLYGIHNQAQEDQQDNDSSVDLQNYMNNNQNNSQQNHSDNQDEYVRQNNQKQENQQKGLQEENQEDQNQSQMNSFIVQDQEEDEQISSEEQFYEEHQKFKKKKKKQIQKTKKQTKSKRKTKASNKKLKKKQSFVSKKSNKIIKKVLIKQKLQNQQQLQKYFVTKKSENLTPQKSIISQPTLVQLDNIFGKRSKLYFKSQSEN